MSPLECDPSSSVGKAEALPFEVPAATPIQPIPSKEQSFPFLVFTLAVAEEGRGRGFKTGRKRLFVWLASLMPTGERTGGRQSCTALPLPPRGALGSYFFIDDGGIVGVPAAGLGQVGALGGSCLRS